MKPSLLIIIFAQILLIIYTVQKHSGATSRPPSSKNGIVMSMSIDAVPVREEPITTGNNVTMSNSSEMVLTFGGGVDGGWIVVHPDPKVKGMNEPFISRGIKLVTKYEPLVTAKPDGTWEITFPEKKEPQKK
jgi:hypothetical protein